MVGFFSFPLETFGGIDLNVKRAIKTAIGLRDMIGKSQANSREDVKYAETSDEKADAQTLVDCFGRWINEIDSIIGDLE